MVVKVKLKKKGVKKYLAKKATKPVALSPVVQIGRKRDTDITVPIRVSKKTSHELLRLADGHGVIQISEQDFFYFLNPIQVAGGVEASLAKMELNLPPAPINILHEADKIIYGDREKAYGNPRFNLDTIAQLWSVYLKRKFPIPALDYSLDITAEDVAQFMILLKTARLIHNPTHIDSLTDQAGYAALQHRIQEL